jgi:16S rRNA (cytidine1402-2'-O)-methyltransferase
MRRFRDDVRGEIVIVIGPARETAGADIGFAVDSLRGLVRAGARPRAAASIVSALTGVPANDLYRGITGRDARR